MGAEFAVEVRVARPADLPELQRLDSACFPLASPDHHPAMPGELEAGVARAAILVAESAGRLIGFIHAESAEDGGMTLRSLAVQDDWRRRGVGSLLADTLLARLPRQPGPVDLVTVTSPRNVPMMRLLFARGFLARALRRDYYGPGKDRLECWRPAFPVVLSGERRLLPMTALTELGQLLENGGFTVRNLLFTGREAMFELVRAVDPLRHPG